MAGEISAWHQIEHKQIYPQPGYVEHDPFEIWENTCLTIRTALSKSGISAEEISAIGVTNQRETIVIWDRRTGIPYYNAIVWQDMRTADICSELSREGGQFRFQKTTGLPLASYFSGPKIRWLLDHYPEIQMAAESGNALFGTMDSWIIWNLTGGTDGGVHITDPTNASRTMLMNLKTLEWDPGMISLLGIPWSLLPHIKPSSEPDSYGYTSKNGPFGYEIPVSGDLGDQQAALFGQACFNPGDAKNTYGTGCFLLLNTGVNPVFSENGLITTVGYKIGNKPAVYALEGSIAIAGALVQWARDKLGIINSAPEIDLLAASVPDNGGVYFVPAFSGLLRTSLEERCPGDYCRTDAFLWKSPYSQGNS